MCHCNHRSGKNKIKREIYIFLLLLFGSCFFLIATSAERININQGPTIIYEKNTMSSSTVVHIFIKGGMASEPEQKKGLAYLTTSLSIGMIDSNSRKQMTEMGTRLTFHIDGEYSCITITCLSSNLEPTLKIILKVLSDPLFSSFRISRIKAHMEHQQNAEKDDPIRLMAMNQRLIFFGKDHYGGSIYGDPESLENIKRKDILKYFQDNFNRDNMVLAISSNLDKSIIGDIFSRMFPEFPAHTKTMPAKLSNLNPDTKKYFYKKDRRQTMIAVVICQPELDPENFPRAFLLENLLGKGMGSKLWYLREDEKLAYHVSADLWQVKSTGLLSIYLKTDHQKKELAYQKLLEILDTLQKKGLESDELHININHAKADFSRLVETSEKRVFLRAFFKIMGKDALYIDRISSEIEKITLSDFNNYLSTVLNPNNRITITIGPEDVSIPTLPD